MLITYTGAPSAWDDSTGGWQGVHAKSSSCGAGGVSKSDAAKSSELKDIPQRPEQPKHWRMLSTALHSIRSGVWQANLRAKACRFTWSGVAINQNGTSESSTGVVGAACGACAFATAVLHIFALPMIAPFTPAMRCSLLTC